MTNLNEYLLAGRKALDRWRPLLNARPGVSTETDSHVETELASDSKDSKETQSLESVGGETNRAAEEQPVLVIPADAPWPPTLDTLMAQVEGLPPYSLTLGACEDGLPFLLDLNYPAPGALLVCADPGSGKTRLLQALFAAAGRQNTPDQVAVSVIAADPEDFMQFAGLDHCQEIFACDDPAAAELIQEIGAMVEERRRGKPGDPAILLLIDGLADLLDATGAETFERLYRVVRHGPRSRIWPVLTLDARRFPAVDPRFLTAFRTRLLGCIRNRHTADQLAGDQPTVDTRGLEQGLFVMPYGDDWLRLWACEIDHTPQEDEE
jgi:hypothetical protein